MRAEILPIAAACAAAFLNVSSCQDAATPVEPYPGPAFALVQNETRPVDRIAYDACDGEQIHWLGEIKYLTTVTDDGAGGYHYNFHRNWTTKGTGLTSGDTYLANFPRNTSHYFRGPFPEVFTQVWNNYVTRTGGKGGFLWRSLEKFVVNGNGELVQDEYVEEYMCKTIVERVSGSGQFVDPQGGAEGWRTFAFTARRYADGSVDGEYQIHNRNTDFTAHGEVTCFEGTDNRFWLGGVEANGPYADTPNHEVGWNVVDNGEGRAAPPDQISYQRVGRWPGYASAWCTSKPDTELFDIKAGNIQIVR